ncbi:MAG TPA: glycosyltransferase, partial [Candidatus Dormibacteraeota bacterium]|nr:glycosyltransferase [Candidatus Dormibacteraeota bacterium]
GQPDSGTAAGAAAGAAPYLVVSALVPYKGVERTIRAANRRGLPLRIVGTGPEGKRLRSIAGPTVRFDEWLSMEALRDAYRSSRALIQAHEEDFGIAPLEAMACGRPVIALRKGGAAEVVAPGTGVLFDEATEGALERAIEEFESRRFNPVEIRRHALGFDRQVYRDGMEALLHEAIEVFLRREADPAGLDRLAGARAERGALLRNGIEVAGDDQVQLLGE